MEIIIGAAVSLITELAGRLFASNPWGTRLMLLLLSLLAAAGYKFLSVQPYYQDLLQIITIAGGIHALLIKPIAGAKTPNE